jgi:NAD(P)-dependent dehydrogenase (short-subunit alcohol dehydrogenase family)
VSVIDLGGRVAVVSGAGGGLGRQHALALAARGASVIVNDLGSGLDGSGEDSSPAQRVASEIAEAGGSAVADANSVATEAGGAAIVATALDAFGRIDIVVNNAGILRDSAFHKMSQEAVDRVLEVHLGGAFAVTRAAWPHMREQGHGRVVFTTSPAGLLGNFGQANYAAAKAGVVGLMKALALEGAEHGITANAISPIAKTRMTENLMTGFMAESTDPKLVSPLVVWLASDLCAESGNVYTVGGGRTARFVVGMTPGWTRTDGDLTPEDIAAHWDEINDTTALSVAREMNDDFRALKKAFA